MSCAVGTVHKVQEYDRQSYADVNPAGLERIFGFRPYEHRSPDTAGAYCPALRATGLLFRGEQRLSAVAQAESALTSDHCLDHDSCVFYALLTLICADRLRLAESYCTRIATLPRWSAGTAANRLLAIVRARIRHLAGDSCGALNIFADTTPYLTGQTPSTVAMTWWSEALIDSGWPREAVGLLERHRDELPKRRGIGGCALLVGAKAAAEAATGDYTSAIRDYVLSGQDPLSNHMRNPAVVPWQTGIALAALELGDKERAQHFARIGLTAARAWGTASGIGRALYVAAVSSDRADMADVAYEVVNLLRAADADNEMLRIIVPLGRSLAARGDPSMARKLLGEAVRLGVEHRNEHVVVQARTALHAITAPQSLTPQEFAVARLVTAGYDNEVIATMLSLARRTVESRLSSVYRKLGVSGRRELMNSVLSSFDPRGRLWS
jgi:DNA-binding CsgD family transcriptional regulator